MGGVERIKRVGTNECNEVQQQCMMSSDAMNEKKETTDKRDRLLRLRHRGRTS
jgi:hypothetical protein